MGSTFTAAPTVAQVDVRLGFQVGPNLSSLALDYSEIVEDGLDVGVESRIGFGAAALVELAFSRKLAGVAEASYARRGYSYPILFGDAEQELIEERVSTSLDFASFSVLGRALPLGRRSIAPYATAGLRLDALVGSNPGRVSTPPEAPEGSPPYYEDEFASLFAGLSLSDVVGLGLAVERARGPEFRVEVRYGRTLTDFLVDAPVEGSVRGFDLALSLFW